MLDCCSHAAAMAYSSARVPYPCSRFLRRVSRRCRLGDRTRNFRCIAATAVADPASPDKHCNYSDLTGRLLLPSGTSATLHNPHFPQHSRRRDSAGGGEASVPPPRSHHRSDRPHAAAVRAADARAKVSKSLDSSIRVGNFPGEEALAWIAPLSRWWAP